MIKRVYGARDYEGRFASWPRVPSERRPLGPALWMETMFLVAGLAVAGLVGIAAAFYFSIRSGNRGDRRPRSTRADLSRPDLNGRPRQTADDGRPVTTFRPAASPKPRRAEAARTADTVGARRLAGPQALPEDPWPGDAEAGNPWPDGAWPDDPMPGDPTATDPKLGTAAREAGETRPIAKTAADREPKPRRRKGFRKGADLDEELWPAESFGGVSDEQFWDDLASDKPLATTARTAQQEAPSRNRLSGPAPGTGLITGPAPDPAPGLDTGPATGPQAVQAPAGDRKHDERGPGGGRRGRYPAPRAASDPTAERTAIQPSYAATQPVQGMKPPLPGATQPVRVAASSHPINAAGRPGATQPREAVTPPRGTATPPRGIAAQPRGTATPPRGIAAQPRGVGTQPAETRRRRPSSAEEDPLTSAAFSLRPSGPVDGRSSLRARDGSADRHDTGTSPYPYSTPSYGDPSSSATQTMSTPPYGESYGNGSPAAPAGEPRRRDGNGGHARPEDPGEGTRPARQANPRGSHQATGSYRSNGSYPANGYPGNGYQGSGHRGNGHRAPYDPRDDYQRLTHQR
jgi:hypothetical protein